jgi:hypothetical protein
MHSVKCDLDDLLGRGHTPRARRGRFAQFRSSTMRLSEQIG